MLWVESFKGPNYPIKQFSEISSPLQLHFPHSKLTAAVSSEFNDIFDTLDSGLKLWC